MKEEKSKSFGEILMEDIKKHGEFTEKGIKIKGLGGEVNLNLKQEEELKKTIVSYYDKKDLAEQILQIQPIYYDKNRIWWAWDKNNLKWKMGDETDVLNFVDKLCTYNTVNSKERNEILEALKQVSRKYKPQEIEPTWIQFKDIIYNISNGEIFHASSQYFVTNPIPSGIDENNFENTPNIDRIFKEWVGE